MNVILNTDSLQAPLTGIGWYTRHLLEGLQKHNDINQLVCIPNINVTNQLTKTSFILKQNLKKVIKFFPGTYASLNCIRNVKFKNKARFLIGNNFIYHEPNYILRPYSGLKLCTVHDLSHIHYPQYHPRERVKFLLKHLAMSIKKAQHIITPSDFIRHEIIDFFKLPPNKISTVYHGFAKLFKPRVENDLKPILARYRLLEKKYLLYVGTLEPRKNIERLIQAFYRLPQQWRKQYPLVLVGSKGWRSGKLEKLIHKLIKKEEVFYLGYIPEADLPYLYSGAHVFLYLSLYEGFGLPVLEALASGIPCITSDVSSIPEVVGDAGLLVNPWSVDAITEILKRLLSDPVLQADLRRKGPIQASKFSWEMSLNKTIDVYESILSSS
jgi:alpha-1,3-rhamnosyl/mannosyltransferase